MSSNELQAPSPTVRKALEKARKMRSLEPLWDLPDPGEVIPTLPAQDLYVILKTVGLTDATDFLALASPTQLRACMDFDCWNKDRLILPVTLDWIRAIGNLGFQELGTVLDKLDSEIPALFLNKSVFIFNRKEVEPPEDGDIPFYQTPDTFFELQPKNGQADDVWRSTVMLLEHMYRFNQDLARKMLTDAQWDLPLQLEERAYKWRTDRMEEEGFWDYL